MLEKFTVKNHLSFKDSFELSFVPSSINELSKNLITPLYSKYKMLKSIGVFGLNSSGKSNLIKSIQFCRDFILGKIGVISGLLFT